MNPMILRILIESLLRIGIEMIPVWSRQKRTGFDPVERAGFDRFTSH